jgi:hypothetical protein
MSMPQQAVPTQWPVRTRCQVRLLNARELASAGSAGKLLFDAGKKLNSEVAVQQSTWSPSAVKAARHVGGAPPGPGRLSLI